MSNLLEQASLVLIPSGYEEDVVYSEIPLDGSGDMTFVRPSDGTRINSAGLVENCPWNLLQYSEDFSNGYWNKGAAVITTNQTTAPNGTNTADKFDETATTDTHQVYTTFAGNLGVSTFFVYAKKAERSGLQITSDQATDPSAIFNLDTGVVYSSSNCTAFIESVGNGWYKCGITYTIDQTTSYPVFRTTNASFATVYAGTAGYGIYIWGAQINIGSTAKPYFPTTNRQDVPRLTYQNGGGGCPSLLLEKQSTNLQKYSEQFDNTSAWSVSNGTIGANATTSPDGTQNADFFNSGSQAFCAINNNPAPPSVTAGTAYTFSVFIKNNSFATGEYIAFNTTDNISSELLASIYPYDKTITGLTATGSPAWSLLSSKVEDFGNGWYRYSITATAANNSGAVVTYLTATSAKNCYLWGWQTEASSHATSYIPTQGSSVTRLADACYKTGISSLIGQSQGVLFLDFEFNNINGVQVILSLHENSNTKRIEIWADSASIYGFVGGSSGFNMGPITGTTGNRYKIAVAYKSGDSAYYVNGTQIGTNATTFTISLANLIFDYHGGGYSPFAKVNEAIVFPTRLTNAQLASLTTL